MHVTTCGDLGTVVNIWLINNKLIFNAKSKLTTSGW